MPSRPEVLTVLGFTFSVLAAAINGIDMAFNVYAIPLKETFNLTQVQVEIVASMTSVGSGLCFLEAVLTANLGYKATVLVTSIGMPLSSLIFSLLAVHNTFIHYRPFLIYLTQLFLSTTNCMACIAIFRLNIQLYPRSHSGKIIGLLTSANSLGKIVFAAMIDLFFFNDLAGFFLALGVASVSVFIICYALLHWKLTVLLERSEDEVCLENTSGNQKPKLKNTVSGVQDELETSFNDLLRSGIFHFTFWPSVIFYACAFANLNNITTIAASADMSNPLVSVYLVSTVIILTRLGFGFLFDLFSSELHGFALLFVGYFSLCTAMLTGMVLFNAYSIYVIIVCIGVSQASGMTVYFSLFVVQFGRSHLSAIVALFYGTVAVVQQIIQLLIGYFYDSNIRGVDSPDLFCVGKDCFYWSFVFLLVLILLVAFTQAFNCVRLVYIPTRRKEYCNIQDSTVKQ